MHAPFWRHGRANAVTRSEAEAGIGYVLRELHQTWRAGRNVARYVRPDDGPELQKALDGSARFMDLARQYADEIIRRSRRGREKDTKKKTARSSKNRSGKHRI